MELNNVLMTDRDWQKLFPAIQIYAANNSPRVRERGGVR